MFPNHSYTGYHANTMGTWNKAACVPQNSQGIGYAFPYTLPEVASYVEKGSFSRPYGTLYAAVENECYRHHFANTGSQPTHWSQSNFQQYLATQQYRRSTTDCYNRHCPNLPNIVRPPPSIKAEPIDNTFHASLSMLENPTQNSAAAYTANWVSSTSSIPPEMRDEPERDDLAAGASAVFTPPANSLAEQFSNLSVNEKWENTAALSMQQWPDLEQGRNGRGVPGSHDERRRAEGRERYVRHSPKVLTWDERIRKGAVQKERIEQRGLERTDKTERDVRESNSGSGRHRGQRGGRSGTITKSERTEREHLSSPVLRGRGLAACRSPMMVKGSRAHGNRQFGRNNQFERKPRIPQLCPPQYYRHGIPLMMSQNSYYNSAPSLIPSIAQQDQRFRNTWLDANLGMNYGSAQMVDYAAIAPCSVQRLRPSSRGRSGYRFPYKHIDIAQDSSKAKSEDQDSSGADQGEEMGFGVGESLKVDGEVIWESETNEEKRRRHDAGVFWQFERDHLEKEETGNGGKFGTNENELCSNSDTTSSIAKPEVSDASVSG